MFTTLCEYLPDAALLTDFDGVAISANSRIESMFGYGRGEIRLLGKRTRALLPEVLAPVELGERVQ